MTFSTIIYLFLLCLGIKYSQAGKVTAIGRTPILISSNNINEISSYTFTFVLDTPTQSGDLLIIKFPESQYTSFTPLANTVCSSYLHAESFIAKTTLSCTLNSDLEFVITLPELNNGAFNPHSVTIQGLKNPSVPGGSGNFAVKTCRGSAANPLDINNAFTQVGIVDAPSSFSSAVVSITANSGINQNGTYKIDLVTTKIVPMKGYIKLIFPAASTIYEDFVCTPTVTADNCTRVDAQTIVLSNFSADIPVGSLSITLTKILNIPYVGSAGSLKVQTWTNSINTILEQKTLAVPTTVAGAISGTPTAYYTNFLTSGQTLVPKDSLYYEVSFKTVNPVPSTGTVKLTVPTGMTLTSCIAYSGFNDISEASPATCTAASGVATIKSFSPLAANQLLTIAFLATNPTATGPTASVQIGSYYDSGSLQLIDQLTSGIAFTMSASLTTMQSLGLTLSTYASASTAVWTFNWQSAVQLTSSTAATIGVFQITIPTGFSFSGTPACQLKTASAGSATTVPCTLSGGVLSLSTASMPASTTFSNTADNTLIVSGSGGGLVNARAGNYQVIFQLQEGGALVRRQSYILKTTAATTLGATVAQLTRDRAKYTLYDISFTAPENINPGIHPVSSGSVQSQIRLTFQTASGTTALFPIALGRENDTTTGSTIPCYGTNGLKPYTTGGKLRCVIYFATSASSSNPAIIDVFDFASVTSGTLVTLQLPKIMNSDSMITPADISVSLIYTQNHITRTYFTNTISLTASLLDAVVGSGNNTNGVSGVPTNLAPTFNPSTINKISRAEVKFTPGSGRSLAVGSKVIMKFPLLPTTSPMSYVFTSSTYCSIGLTVAQPCLVYPEVGWVVIKNLVQAFTAGQEYSIMIFNIQNPPFAAALKGALNLVTVSTNREFEEFIYTSFSSFSTGGLSNINVFPSSYEANAVDVEYNWIFVTSNLIPAGGSIQLTFPPNTYSLDSDPPVTAEVITGLSPASATSAISYTFVINVATVKNFAAVPAGTLIRVVTKGVKNPIEATRTTNFAILTLNSAGYTIDSNTLITGLNILTANPTGVIVFNYFYTTPSNGNMKGNYYLSFYPQTSYPKGTTITILFPSTEFDATDYYDDTCFISGALTTLESCTLDKTINTFTIITDQKLEIEPGMPPINIYFPHIRNFNEELSSGVVTVRAVYDSVILDDSGNAEDNRKATTSNGATSLTTSAFSIVPSTEGQSATYSVTLKPLVSFGQDTVIQFEFPDEFTTGLGETINCRVPSLVRSSDVPVQCVVDERKINITKIKSFDTTTDTDFTVSISGVINPNRLPATTGTIAVFILINETIVSEYTLSIGTLSYTAAPQILDVTAFTSSNVLTRKLANYDFTLSPTLDINLPSTLTAEYSSEYSVQTFSKSPTLSVSSGAAVSVVPTGNSILQTLSAAITSGSSFALSLANIANPFDSGEKRYPTVYIQDDTANKVTVRTYDNLIKPLNLIYNHGGEIVTINDDLTTTIYLGQANKYYFKFQSPTTQALTIKALPLSPAFVDVSDITVPIGATQASIWIGVPSSASTETVYIEWEIVGDTLNRFWVIRPLGVNIVKGQTEVFVDEVVYVPAGGRTRPCYVTLSNSPLNDLEIQLYQRGSIPTYVNVYPSKLVFTKGELTKPFWVSSGTDTRGISGSVLFLINGTNKDAYFMPKRLRSFIISRGDTSIPYLLRNKLAAVGENYITVNASTSEASTILYFIAPRGTPAPVFEDIKDKKIRYDYYAGEYVVGEYVNDTSSYNYTFNVTGLKPGMDYDSYFYIEDFSGNQGNASFSYQFTTSQDYPQQVYLNVLQASMAAADTTTLLQAIADATGLKIDRFEIDLTVLSGKGSGDSSTRLANSSSLNKRVKYSGSSTSIPSVSTGTRATFIIFPDVNDPFAPSCAQAVALIKARLSTININYGGTSASPLIGTTYGVSNQQVEPDDIRWGSGMTLTVTKSYTTITISGIKLNSIGTVYASAYTASRKLFYSTQDSVTAAMRYLQQTPSESSSYTGPGRRLANLYGQQSCVISSDNELVVGCDGNDLPAEDITRSDYDYFYSSSALSSYQVARQADSWYFKGDSVASIDISGSGSNGTITLSGLTEGTTYTVNLAATAGYSKYPMRMLDKYVISQEITTDKHIVKSVDGSILSVSLASIVFGLSMMLFI